MSLLEGAIAHLDQMTDHLGLFEHAELAKPRVDHGYCVDDAARLLVLCAALPPPRAAAVERLERQALEFTLAAQGADGRTRNRRDHTGRFEAKASTEDCWGRSLWGLGVAAASSPHATHRTTALQGFERGALQRGAARRTVAFAALGAAAVLDVAPAHRVARRLLTDSVPSLSSRADRVQWAWPEARLAYANAALPAAMMATGSALELEWLERAGLDLLSWLVEHETSDGHLSVTPVGGSGPYDLRPSFDQQPIEAGSIAGACARAFDLTGDPAWVVHLERAAAWFTGANDVGCAMVDPGTGGCYDGLSRSGPNHNQGAESTLALASTFAYLERLEASR